ncbi:MAG: AAA family ATPase [Cyanobacteria bacterium J06633_8]
MVGAIVTKLMAKNAEDRYQSALGLKHDLAECLSQWKEIGAITEFELGQRDLCDRFLIPEKLYGREAEVQKLLDAFDRVSQGSSELMLVAGFSGIGKTAAIDEVHKPIVRQRGYFTRGKFDQFNRNIPFSAFVQAFRNLMQQLLSESDGALSHWRTGILEVVGSNGQVLIEIIPELEKIIGPQPAAPELSGAAAQNRFNLLFQKFISVFTSQDHPLVMFLDDLQWADSASLKLIQVLMGENETNYLLLLGAYRDNEVFPAHSLMLTLNELEKQSATISTITLTPLLMPHINQLVAETLSYRLDVAQPLTDLIYRQTKGNPFFTTQCLKGLYKDKLISFNAVEGTWEYDLVQIQAATCTDDVVAFMTNQLQKLPQGTQNVLALAACIGNQFDLETLAIVCRSSKETVADDLWVALQEGLIIPITDSYKFYHHRQQGENYSDEIAVDYRFLHDRVQQAAYCLIPDEQKQITHVRIGRLLLASVSPERLVECIFTVANHLNKGIDNCKTEEERLELLHLNRMAGIRAKETTAYESAIAYFEIARQLLPTDSWQQCYEVTLEVYLNLAEVSYLSGQFTSSLALVELIAPLAQCHLDRVAAYRIATLLFTSQGELLQALEYGKKSLDYLNFDLSETDLKEKLAACQTRIATEVADRKIEQLVSEPEATEPDKCTIIKILNDLSVPTYILQKVDLCFLGALSIVWLSLRFGMVAESSYGFSCYGMYLGQRLGNYQSGYEFGQLAKKLAKRFRKGGDLCKACFVLASNILPWVRPLREVEPVFNEGLVAGLEAGELIFAGNILMDKALHLFYAGGNVLEIQQTLPQDLEFTARTLNFQIAVDAMAGLNIWVADITQSSSDCLPTEQQYLENCTVNNNAYAICHYWILKTKVLCLYGRYEAALTAAQAAEEIINAIPGKYEIAALNFYQSITVLEYCRSHSLGYDNPYFQKAKLNQVQLEKWAANCPENFAHKQCLVDAVMTDLLGNKMECIDLYDRAIAGAKTHQYLQEEALANELAAKFYLDWDKEKIAAVYMQEAYYCYARWGAQAKVADLETRYPELLRPILQSSATSKDLWTTLTILAAPTTSSHSSNRNSSSSISFNQTFDFISILKASQALAGTIQLDELLCQLTQIILQNSGGNRCALILPNERVEWQVRAIATPDNTQLCVQPLANNPNLPVKLINYVKNTQETVVINELKTDLPVIDDYLRQRQPKSLLCLPLLNQGQIIGILYLKNRFTIGAFTKERVEVLKFLCTQAAISLENARLYKKAQEYAQQLEQSQLQVVQSEKMASLGNLVAGVAHEINNPIGFLNGSISNGKDYVKDLLEYLSVYHQQQPPNPEVEELAEDIDLEFLLEDLPKLLDAMKGATKRIKNISTSLRIFSRADTDHFVSSNIHEGIDSTLLILKYRLKASENRPAIQVTKDYGDLPIIECFPGQLNQVFMNILANAIDMFDEMAQTKSYQELEANPQQITIRTGIEFNQVYIRIRDNGKGMSKDVQAKIFDNLFTTKEVGKGTGLGLAIARQIVVEKHGGSLDVFSEVGKGTEFLVKLLDF